MSEQKKILIVDDEPNILLSLEFLMKKNHYEVFIARDGAEAMQIIEQEVPNVIILDIMMPKVDGFEVCEFVKAAEALKHIKIIFLTAKSKESDIKRGYDVGADLYVTKPFSTRNLLQQVKEITHKHS